LLLGLALCGALRGAEFDQGAVFSFIEENDLVVNTDRHYTQGIKLAFLFADGAVPKPVRWLSGVIPELWFERKVDKFGFQMGQSIYTPADITTPELLKSDRPYAGWLYTGFILHRRGFAAEHILTLESFQMDVGVIGPESLAKEAQTWVHEVRGFDLPQGWDNQLKTEPGLALKYERSWIWPILGKERPWLDCIPHAGFSLGNVETSLRAGALLRAGYHLPEDFGVQTISSLSTMGGGWSKSRAGGRWGFYVFTGLEGGTVLYTTFLDGNLWHTSHQVEKEYFVVEWKSGGVLVLGRVEAGFTYVLRSREFTDQTEQNGYGSLFVKLKF
jgi:hypothetical protein